MSRSLQNLSKEGKIRRLHLDSPSHNEVLANTFSNHGPFTPGNKGVSQTRFLSAESAQLADLQLYLHKKMPGVTLATAFLAVASVVLVALFVKQRKKIVAYKTATVIAMPQHLSSERRASSSSLV